MATSALAGRTAASRMVVGGRHWAVLDDLVMAYVSTAAAHPTAAKSPNS